MKDAIGQDIRVGDEVILAHTAKSAGIRWSRFVVSRLTDKSFWSMSPVQFAGGKTYERGPHPLRNCIKIP